MRTIVAIIVYDRFDNIKEWIRCYKMCNTENSEIIIIHNYKNKEDITTCRNICLKEHVKYIPRKNIGYDIGALQDVCKERLPGFPPDWNYLFWITDDVLPMWKQFIPAFIKEVEKPNVGVACLEISKEVTTHIRTSGFIISKDIALKLKFPANPILSKDDCYNFEHRSEHSFFKQIIGMGKLAVQVSNTLSVSHLWDIDHRIGLNRWEDHYREFPKSDVKEETVIDSVLFIATIYESYPGIISSLICQTNPNWHLLLIHDGKNNTGLDKIVKDANDDRITYIETDVRKGQWGHPIRKETLENIKNDKIKTKCNFIVITNSDNYYVPVFVEKMIQGFVYPGVVATYCSSFIHGYKSPQSEGAHEFGVIQSKIELGHIDCGGVMVRKSVACEVGWNDLSIYSDWTYFNSIIAKYGRERWSRVLGCLFSHN